MLPIALLASTILVAVYLLPVSIMTPAVIINEVMPNPSSGPEWVELYNRSNQSINLGGWKIDDDTIGGSQTLIAADTFIEPGAFLVIELHTSILNNTGSDAAQLLDLHGNIVDSFWYSGTSAGMSYARTPDGSDTWVKGPPTYGTWNVQPTPTPTAADPGSTD
ncbi:MAG TPA: lamin tail domain-containing protein, partial [Roseiflexaceae bacterium]|nr:lamin tail domain-containing protein [Roseiflexaceae bacterium]